MNILLALLLASAHAAAPAEKKAKPKPAPKAVAPKAAAPAAPAPAVSTKTAPAPPVFPPKAPPASTIDPNAPPKPGKDAAPPDSKPAPLPSVAKPAPVAPPPPPPAPPRAARPALTPKPTVKPGSKAPVPEEARRAFVKGNTAFTDAKSPADLLAAAARYEEAAKLAPSWPDPLYNLAKAREAAGDPAGALTALRAYLSLPLPPAEQREALDWSYALEERASKKSRDDASAAAADKFAGTWSRTLRASSGATLRQTFTLARDGSALTISASDSPKQPFDARVEGDRLEFKWPHTLSDASGPWIKATGVCRGRLSADGRSIEFKQTLLPYTPAQEAYWKEWGAPGDPCGGKPAWTKE
jgi:hypothetical protein